MRVPFPASLLLLLAALVVLPAGTKAAELDPALEGSFSIVVIPDTQDYVGQGTKKTPKSTAPVTNKVFENHVHWIKDNHEKQHVVFISHVGNIVDRNNETEWGIARQCMDVLHGLVPYGITVGDSSLFQKVFGA